MSSKLGVNFKAHCHWSYFQVTAKSAAKRTRSLAGRGLRTPPFCERVKGERKRPAL
jgi:hypothetical protein